MQASVDPDQTQCSAASDLGLQWLPKSLLWAAMCIWVNSGEQEFIHMVPVQARVFLFGSL